MTHPLANRHTSAHQVKFNARNKKSVIANVGVARELAGWCWSLAVVDG